jgi:hypothetical protein
LKRNSLLVEAQEEVAGVVELGVLIEMLKKLYRKLKVWYLKTFRDYYYPVVRMRDGSLYYKERNGSLRRLSGKKKTRARKAFLKRKSKIREYREFFKL